MRESKNIGQKRTGKTEKRRQKKKRKKEEKQKRGGGGRGKR